MTHWNRDPGTHTSITQKQTWLTRLKKWKRPKISVKPSKQSRLKNKQKKVPGHA